MAGVRFRFRLIEHRAGEFVRSFAGTLFSSRTPKLGPAGLLMEICLLVSLF
jgi:hypothetical protein